MENRKDKRLAQLLASYGADRGRWPPDAGGLPMADDGAARQAHDIDRVLSMASDPALPDGAMARLMQRVAAEPSTAKVIAFPRRHHPPAKWPDMLRYAAALPLAASLALGIYLGARGSLDYVLPPSLTGGIALNDDQPDDLGGVGDADAYAEDTAT